MQTTTEARAAGTHKVRREVFGGKRAEGWERQKQHRPVKPGDPEAIRQGASDRALSSVGGLVPFFAFLKGEGVFAKLRKTFGPLKRGRNVVYPMGGQLRLLIGLLASGMTRVFRVETLASDRVFAHLVGCGCVPSVDVLYDDLRRIVGQDLDALESMVTEQGLAPVVAGKFDELTLDVDTTVTPLFGKQSGAEKGYNPRYHGRPSHQPLIARIAETGTIVAGRLRTGDRTLGSQDAGDIADCIEQVHCVSPSSIVTVRIDAGGDCAEILDAVDRAKAYFVVKAKLTANLLGAVAAIDRWTTVERNADGTPARQVADVAFQREGWKAPYRVFAVRSCDRESGKQIFLWEGLDLSVQVYVTNDRDRDADTLARLYDDRAGIELLIRDLKESCGLGKACSEDFEANEVMLLLRLLTYNLMRRWALSRLPERIARWTLTWIRSAFIRVPARLLRAAGRWVLRMAPRPLLC